MINVLIIEDDFFIRDLYQKAFQKAGYTVQVAVDGEQGIEALRNGVFDIVLLDVMMPKITGIEVLKTVRSESFPSHNVPIFLITNLGQNSIIEEAFKLGADGYFLKSQLTPDEIVAEIGTFLEKIGVGKPDA